MKLRRSIRKVLLALALAGACLRAAPAHAGATEDRFAEGTALFTDGKLEEALKVFQEVWKTTKSYDVALMLAHTERNLGKYRDAAEHYTYAIANYPPTGDADVREEAVGLLAEVKKGVGTVRIRVPVKDASVKVDGAPIDAAALDHEIFLAKGKAVIEASAPGYQTAKRTLEIKGGESEDVTITLQPEQVAPRSKVPAFVIGGVGAAGLIVGFALIGAAEGKKGEAFKLHDELGSDAGCAADPVKCQALRDATGQADALGNGGVAAVVIGVLAGGAAAGYMLFPSRKPAPAGAPAKEKAPAPAPVKAALLPVIGPNTGGLLLSGSF